MNFFTILLSNDNDGTITELIDEQKKEVSIFHLNQHSELIDEKSVFLICIGGDKGKAESWWLKNNNDVSNKGLKFIASLIERPSQYDPSDKKNYKITVRIEYTFSIPVKKEEFIYWPDSYDTDASVATKGKQTQAIGLLREEQKYLGLLRGAMFYNHDLRIFYAHFFGEDFLKKIEAPTKRFIEKNLSFSEEMQLPKNNTVNGEDTTDTDYVKNFSQIIYYGVPGSGKSNKIDRKTENLPDDQKIRVVFHPEYTNADFVGQILPDNSNGNISYKFKPGPFSRILRRAYLNPSKKYYLIIEEINRGNAAAVFGDIFQLLDRITDDKEISSENYRYSKGWSRYSIDNDFINWYIRENLYADRINRLENEDDGIAVKSSDESYKSIEIGNLHFSGLTGIRLPPNLSLYATMNTSDQNVFTLDNAFQRRWDMQLVKNQFDDKDEKATAQRNAKIGGSDVTWEKFQTHINRKIGELSSSMGMSSMEDKRLGCWFVKAENSSKKDEQGKDVFIITKKVFADKVLKYLWDDAFKFSREEIFDIKDKTASLEAIVSAFKGTDETKPCNWKIFKDISFTLKDGTAQSGSDAGETE